MSKWPTTPTALAKDAQRRELAAIRKKAWITRRQKYGSNGNGKYNASGR